MKNKSSGGQTREAAQRLLNAIVSAEEKIGSKNIVAGFDGFVDSIVKVIKSKKKSGMTSFFKTKKEFAKYILDKGNSSFGLELEELAVKVGGNMPIMSNALGALGMRVNCIGALGYPQVHNVFHNMSGNCNLHSFANPGSSTAYEFHDGKILIAQMNELNNVGWHDLKQRIGMQKLQEAYKECQLMCMVNWSEIEKSTEIWAGILNEVVSKNIASTSDRIIFFDFADCSRRSKQIIREAVELVCEFSRHGRVVLGLNQNESSEVFNAIFTQKPGKKLEESGKKIFSKLNIDTLLLHSSTTAISIDKTRVNSVKSFHVKHPKVSTGAGDHFNAGFCTGLLMKLEPELCLMLGHAISGCFVQSGQVPGWKELNHFLLRQTIHKK